MEAVDPIPPQSGSPESQPTPCATTAGEMADETKAQSEEVHPQPQDMANQSANAPSTPPRPAHSFSIWHLLQSLLRICLLTILLAALAALVFEMRTSWLQSYLLPPYAKSLTWQVAEGPSDAIVFPAAGPYDQRLGYAGLGRFTSRLNERGYAVTAQSRFSAPLLDYSHLGLFPPYREKSQAGLTLYDCRREPLHVSRYPTHQFVDFAAIPPLALTALLYIENRDLLDEAMPLTNPAVDWPRFFNAALSQLGKKVGMQDHGSGGSTLATTLVKFRHSPEGRTNSGKEKLRQMASATVRAYLQGPLTLTARQQVALDYLNSVPLAAAPGYGEVHGLGDGLHVWFGADVAQSYQLLAEPMAVSQASPELLAAQGLALRQVVALLIAHRRPSFYLPNGRHALATLTDSYLRLLAQQQAISGPLRDAALAASLTFRDFKTAPAYSKIDGLI